MDAEERLANLESTVAFQDRTIDELSQALAGQQARIARLEDELRLLTERLREPARLVRDLEDEDPPPHY